MRPALMDDAARARPDIGRLVALSDVVKASDEDLRWLYPDRSDEQVARSWLASGAALVVVTRGGANPPSRDELDATVAGRSRAAG